MSEATPNDDSATAPESLIRYHQHRRWEAGGYKDGRPIAPPANVDEPCGDCGKAKAEHPVPVVIWLPTEQMAARILAMENALRYIERPTMGLPSGADPERFARDEASEVAVRLALETCIRIARRALDADVG